jgi:hypothetical protein
VPLAEPLGKVLRQTSPAMMQAADPRELASLLLATK